MIKYDYAASSEFMERYDAEVLQPTTQKVSEFLQLVPSHFSEKYKNLFNNEFVSSILLASAEDLVGLIDFIYSELPEMADRYWPAFLLGGIPVPDNIGRYKVRSADEKKTLDEICVEVCCFLASDKLKVCSFLQRIKVEIEGSKSYVDRRNALEKLKKAALGDVDTSGQYLDIFPSWINNFRKIFSYSELSRRLGLAIVNEWSIDVCLYCNNEGIQTRGDEHQYRADLDHFHPQSKFPFLAVTLSNLVPSGGLCNRAYKKDKDMIGFAHPYVSGVTSKTLFFIDYPVGAKVAKDNYSVKVLPQGGEVDRSLIEFEIAHLYSNDREMKSWLCTTFATIDWVRGFGFDDIPEQLLNQIVDVSNPPHIVRAKKFKVDTVNQFYGSPLLSFP